MNSIQQFKFSINNWQHLYSLQLAIDHNQQLTGSSLSIQGSIINQVFLHNKTTDISIGFAMLDAVPEYPMLNNDTYQLGLLEYSSLKLSTNIQIDRKVFDELRKNLMEYADIEGIHIVVTMGIILDEKHCTDNKSYPIVQFDYAMKGDS